MCLIDARQGEAARIEAGAQLSALEGFSVMQKLARTLSAAENPRKSIHDIPLLPHCTLGCSMSYEIR
jgi:hypothetical protein